MEQEAYGGVNDKPTQQLEEKVNSKVLSFGCWKVERCLLLRCLLLERHGHNSDTSVLIVDVGAGGFTLSPNVRLAPRRVCSTAFRYAHKRSRVWIAPLAVQPNSAARGRCTDLGASFSLVGLTALDFQEKIWYLMRSCMHSNCSLDD